jgi:hypothetical protein
MTDTPGDGEEPQDPYGPPRDPYAPQGQPPYGQPQYDQPQYDQPQYGQAAYGQPQYGQPPYGQPAYPPTGYPPTGYVPDHPKATSSLVLGILGIVVCGIVAPFAWVVGKRTVREIDASNGQLGGRGSAQAGYVLGVIGTVLLGLGLALLLLVVVVAVAGGIASSST